MPSIGINRLRLRGPPHQAARSTFLIEDACRTELPDNEKLVLIRRLELGRGVTAREPGERTAAVRRAYEEATRNSRHGGDDAGGNANCVWFASRAEARLLLLRLLLAGKRPNGWYWPLAVPGWRGHKLAEWLGETLPRMMRREDSADLVELILVAVEAGATDIVIEALARSGGPSNAGSGSSMPIVPFQTPFADLVGAPSGRLPVIADVIGTLHGLRARMPIILAGTIEAVVRRIGPKCRSAGVLLERLLVRASPALALSPVLLRQLAALYAELLAGPLVVSATADDDLVAARAPQAPTVPRQEATPDAQLDIQPGESSAPGSAEAMRESQQAIDALPTPSTPPAPVQPHPLFEARSEAAGLWLVIPSLIRMGLREWLGERPELLADDPGRVLMRTIAAHHRVAFDDPALRPLAFEDEDFEPPEWARLWRAGLDRWLDRRAHVKLARLVWRPGWLRVTEERLIVRFPPAAADIRLRRLALDIDPGWTDWLGLAVRYRYAEREKL